MSKWKGKTDRIKCKPGLEKCHWGGGEKTDLAKSSHRGMMKERRRQR